MQSYEKSISGQKFFLFFYIQKEMTHMPHKTDKPHKTYGYQQLYNHKEKQIIDENAYI